MKGDTERLYKEQFDDVDHARQTFSGKVCPVFQVTRPNGTEPGGPRSPITRP
jgi:hypothetical protein